MEVKSKYDIGDSVYFMLRSLPVKAKISAVNFFVGRRVRSMGSCTISAQNGEKESVTYFFEEYNCGIAESSVFATAKELQFSLFEKLV